MAGIARIGILRSAPISASSRSSTGSRRGLICRRRNITTPMTNAPPTTEAASAPPDQRPYRPPLAPEFVPEPRPLGIVTHEARRRPRPPALSGSRDNGAGRRTRRAAIRFQLCAYRRPGCLRRAAPRGRISRRVPRGPACPLTVLPRLQQRLRDTAILPGGRLAKASRYSARAISPIPRGRPSSPSRWFPPSRDCCACVPNWRPGSSAPCHRAAITRSGFCSLPRSPLSTSVTARRGRSTTFSMRPPSQAANAITDGIGQGWEPGF